MIHLFRRLIPCRLYISTKQLWRIPFSARIWKFFMLIFAYSTSSSLGMKRRTYGNYSSIVNAGIIILHNGIGNIGSKIVQRIHELICIAYGIGSDLLQIFDETLGRLTCAHHCYRAVLVFLFPYVKLWLIRRKMRQKSFGVALAPIPIVTLLGILWFMETIVSKEYEVVVGIERQDVYFLPRLSRGWMTCVSTRWRKLTGTTASSSILEAYFQSRSFVADEHFPKYQFALLRLPGIVDFIAVCDVVHGVDEG